VENHPARDVFTATDSTARVDRITGAYREGPMVDLAHAVENDRALRDCRPAYGPDGTRWPSRQLSGGTQVLWPCCVERAADRGSAVAVSPRPPALVPQLL
jgi:hypothetical protein